MIVMWFVFDVPEILTFIVSGIQNLTVFFDDQYSNNSLAFFYMHVTTYDFFYKLANIDRYKDEPLPQFSLYGFVIYDPIEHVDFKKNLEENYKFLDQISGENFLFFSVIELDEEKEGYFKGRPYFEAYHKLDQDYSEITRYSCFKRFSLWTQRGNTCNSRKFLGQIIKIKLHCHNRIERRP